jgi:eukaryotic translation initiation factor 2C
VQDPRLEIIKDLSGMATELINQFRQRAGGNFPQRILFFRDGVSEGQYGEVAIQEVQKLKETLRTLGCPNTKLSFMVLSKRHGVRFFAKNPQDADRKGNIMAGTVVDTGITHPFEFDFYLNSHQGLQGTSKSGHYHMLFDDNGLTADQAQEIAYRTCYLYARA